MAFRLVVISKVFGGFWNALRGLRLRLALLVACGIVPLSCWLATYSSHSVRKNFPMRANPYLSWLARVATSRLNFSPTSVIS